MTEQKKPLVKCERNRILVTDDEAAIRSLFKTILSFSFEGVKVDEACNGLEAVMAFREGHHGIILMDLRMPEMDGHQAFLAIQDICHEKGWQMPAVVFCTGFDPPDTVRQIVGDAKYHNVLRRPVTSDDIINAVRSRFDVIA